MGTENPAGLMTKYLTRQVMDHHLESLSQERAAGRAQSGLEIQGKQASPAALAPTEGAAGELNTARVGKKSIVESKARVLLEDNWVLDPRPRRAWSMRLAGGSWFETTNCTWEAYVVQQTIPLQDG